MSWTTTTRTPLINNIKPVFIVGLNSSFSATSGILYQYLFTRHEQVEKYLISEYTYSIW